MKDVWIVSLSSTRGTRHWALTIKKRNALWLVLATIAVLLLTMVGYIRFLQWQTDDVRQQLNQDRQALTRLGNQLQKAHQAYDDVTEQRQILEATIARKSEQFTAMSDRLESLEDKLDTGFSANDTSIPERLDLASIAVSTREVTLSMLPNGAPIDYIYVSSSFGRRMHPIKGRNIFHAGMDLAANIKTPVHATADGVVELVSHRRTGYGNMLLLSHSLGFKTRYAHLKKIMVKRGEFVHKGQLIAYSGNSGSSTGPHLHYEVTYAGKPINPKPFLTWSLDNYEHLFKAEKHVPWPSLIAKIENLREMWQQPLSQKAPFSGESSNSAVTSTSMGSWKDNFAQTMPSVLAVMEN